MTSRIDQRFAKLRAEGRAGLVAFVTAGDPDLETSLAIVRALPRAGADIIELGMPFSDPMADGPAIQASSLRALSKGMTMAGTLRLAAQFRKEDAETPLILMGYANPVLHYGPEAFARDAAAAGVDGVIIVDIPPEEDEEVRPALEAAGLALVRLIAPTSAGERLARLVSHASGFLYVISITGVTGTREFDPGAIEPLIASIRKLTTMPVAVGFGIKTAPQAAAAAGIADGVVVGSALVDVIARGLGPDGRPGARLVEEVVSTAANLAAAIASARK